MSLQQKISDDLRTAMREKNEEVKSLLRVIIGEMGRELEKQLSDDCVIGIIKKMKDSAIIMENTNEIKILDRYLPNMLSKGELNVIVKSLIDDNDITDMKGMGKVMSELKSKYGRTYDGKIASEVFKELLMIK